MGAKRDSVWRETGILKKFPATGLKVRWRMEVSLGYSGPAVADGRVFVTDFVRKSGRITNNPGTRDKLVGLERVLCFDAETGKELWKHEDARKYALSYPSGPRCTPTVDGDRVYTLGAEGHLLCLDAKKGTVIWRKSLMKEYSAKTPIWGHAAHPLVDGKLLYCLVGGKGSVAVAFDKNTGREVWKALSAVEPGYCPPMMIEHAERKQLLIWHTESLNSLNPKTGKVYWTFPLKPSFEMSITAPRLSGDNLFVSGMGRVGVLLKLNAEKPAAEVVWRGTPQTAVYGANSTAIIDNGMIYGCDCHQGALMGVRLKDGKRLWSTFRPTTGGKRRVGQATVFLVKHANGYFLFSETGDLILAKLSAKGYEEISRFHLLDPMNSAFGRKVVWSHPAFANRCVFARNDKELVCVSLAAE
ncbi:MAG: PQQ-like beta-propeller repeat protein [Planctomycetes bacterium]|nr:PQQ-like beta-propeller repeat protein [Planctomycetota bacterium]